MYKPLPESVTIKQSGVHGLGLFADQKIMDGTNLGMSHLRIGDTIFRTPLGGFINHSNTPNCLKVEVRMTREDMKGDGLNDNCWFISEKQYHYKKWNLIVSKDVKEGDELTVRYTFYKI